VKVIGAALLLILLGASGCAPASTDSGLILVSDTPTITPSPTATIDWFPATSTFTPAPTFEITPSPTPSLGLAEVLLEDDFGQSGAMSVVKNSTGSAAYGKNEFTLAVAAAKGYLTSLRGQPALSDFFLEVSANPSLCRENDSYGLLLRAANEWSYYRWVITCGGQTRLERVKDGRAVLIQDWLISPQIRLGPGVDLRLAVWMYGSQMRFFIDGVEQFSARDPLFSSGSVGFFARAGGDTPLTVNFSQLSVRAIEPQALPTSTLTPAATPGS
jgi:hypothetical protein